MEFVAAGAAVADHDRGDAEKAPEGEYAYVECASVAAEVGGVADQASAADRLRRPSRPVPPLRFDARSDPDTAGWAK